MGKGDPRTRRGKLWRGTYGNSRPKPSKKRKRREGREGREGKEQAAKPEAR